MYVYLNYSSFMFLKSRILNAVNQIDFLFKIMIEDFFLSLPHR